MTQYKIKALKIQNFRNLENNEIHFSEKINCIFGENGNGKTNLLEAIHVIMNRKSFRKNTSFPQILSIDGESSEIYFSSVLKSQKFKNQEDVYSGKIDKESWTCYLNNQFYKKKLKSPSIFINPVDSYNFHSSAQFRRKLFNNFLSVYFENYEKILNKYEQLIRMRNNLLQKRPYQFQEQILAIDDKLSEYAYIIIQKRIEFVEKINLLYSETFKTIFDQDHLILVKYKSEWEKLGAPGIKESLKLNFNANDRHTSIGPHLDDFEIYFDGINAFEFCSLGQQKMSFLSLLFAYIELFRYKFDSYPVVLIDDVSGELDEVRWTRLVRYLESRIFQVFITTANKNFKDEIEKIEHVKNFLIKSGKIISLENNYFEDKVNRNEIYGK